MSQSKQSAVDRADGTMASHTRRQTRMRARDENDEEKQPVQSSTHVSPAMRIYRHALESIFAMLQLKDLSRALAVSRSWSAAVRSMKPIGVSMHSDFWSSMEEEDCPALPPIERLVTGPLMRHVVMIQCSMDNMHSFNTPLTREALALLAEHAPNLTSLDCSLSLTPAAAWILPAKLTLLHFGCVDLLSPADTNALFICASALSLLDSLCLWLEEDNTAAGVDFRLLAASPSLTNFTFCCGGGHPSLDDNQVDQIRASLGHLRRISVAEMNATSLARFLRPPVAARWQGIGLVPTDATAEALLVTLPSLTRLDLLFTEDRPHADFLSQLPQLKVLELWTDKSDDEDDEDEEEHNGFYVPPAAMLNSLLPCTGLTELDLHCGFSSAQLSVLFAKLTSLAKLTINGHLESLECFAAGPITRSLEGLCLEGMSLSPSELPRLYALRGLRLLQLEHCFSPPLDAATLDSLSPPTQLFPLLTEFDSQWRTADGEWESVERRGSSYDGHGQ